MTLHSCFRQKWRMPQAHLRGKISRKRTKMHNPIGKFAQPAGTVGTNPPSAANFFDFAWDFPSTCGCTCNSVAATVFFPLPDAEDEDPPKMTSSICSWLSPLMFASPWSKSAAGGAGVLVGFVAAAVGTGGLVLRVTRVTRVVAGGLVGFVAAAVGASTSSVFSLLELLGAGAWRLRRAPPPGPPFHYPQTTTCKRTCSRRPGP